MSHSSDKINQSDSHNARGIELADRGWLDEALSEFRKAIELDPNSAHAYDNLGTILSEKGDLLEALEQFLAALSADPHSATARHYLASFWATQAHDLASNQYHQAIQLEYDFPDAQLNLAMALADRGRLDEAVVELEIAHQQAPEDELIQHELACCLIDLERYPDAINHLKQITKNHPEHVEAYVDLGIAFTAQGFYAEAQGALNKALDLDPNDFAAHYHIAALFATWSRPDDALHHLEVAATHDREKIRMWIREDHIFDLLRENQRYEVLLT